MPELIPVAERPHDFRAIRKRLRNPPNAVKDDGIDLKRAPKVASPSIAQDESNEDCAADGVTREEQPTTQSKPSCASIEKAVCDRFGIGQRDFESPSRQSTITLARQIAYYLAVEIAGVSLPRAAYRFRKDHTTILHGYRKIKRLLVEDYVLAAVVDQITQELAAKTQHEIDGSSERKRPLPTIRDVQRVVARHTLVSIESLCSHERGGDVARARTIAMYAADKLTGKSRTEIGKGFGGFHCGSIISACRRAARWRRNDPLIDQQVKKIIDEIRR